MNAHRPAPHARLGLLLAAAFLVGGVPAAASPEDARADYIVKIKGSPGNHTTEVARKLTSRHSGTMRYVYRHALSGYAATMTRTQARQVASDPLVEKVVPSKADVVTAEGGTSRSDLGDIWHLDRINQRSPQLDGDSKIGLTGKGVTIYVFDNGIRTTHEEFAGRASIGFTGTGTAECKGWHGTGVASTAGGRRLGVAKDAQLVSVQPQCTAMGPTAELLAAIDWITGNAKRPAVVNMSVHLSTGSNASDLLEAAIGRSIANGITYVAATGNQGADACESLPQRIPEVITVAGTSLLEERMAANGQTDQMWAGSNHGRCVDLLAPATDITVASASSNELTRSASGTSFSAPMVAGAAALYLQEHPDAPPAEVANALIHRSTKGAVDIRDTATPNRLLYVGP